MTTGMFKNIRTQFKYLSNEKLDWIYFSFFNRAHLDLMNTNIILIFSKAFL